MGFITAEGYQEWSNQTFTGGELASLEVICEETSVAIKDRLNRIVEEQEVEGMIFDAPTTQNLLIGGRYAPILISSLEVYLDLYANGNPASFTSDDLLEMYTDYVPARIKDQPTYCTGLITKTAGVWSQNYYRRPGQMAYSQVDAPGAIKVNFTGGWAAEDIPKPIFTAGYTMVSQCLATRQYGFIKGSESWNGYSYNIPGVGLMLHGITGNPDILGFLYPYINHDEGFG